MNGEGLTSLRAVGPAVAGRGPWRRQAVDWSSPEVGPPTPPVAI